MENQDNAKLLLDYLIANGFNPHNYKNILELVQSVPNSISKYLVLYPEFLLSDKVSYQDLVKYDIKGANGTLTPKGIIVSETIAANNYFSNSNNECYNYPNIFDFNAVITNGFTTNEDLIQILNSFLYPIKDRYYGLVLDKYLEDYKHKLLLFKF